MSPRRASWLSRPALFGIGDAGGRLAGVVGRGGAHSRRVSSLCRGRVRRPRPDLYRGETSDQPDEAEQKMMALSMDQAERDLRGAVDFISDHEAARQRPW